MNNLDLVFERMSIDLAKSIVNAEGKLTMEQGLSVFATPAITIDYTKEDVTALKGATMWTISQFVRKNKRFLNLAKSAITIGLAKEWVPTLTDIEKKHLLDDSKIVDGVDEDGFIVVNQRWCEIYARQSKADTFKYGTMAYESKTAKCRVTQRSKPKLNIVNPDSQLSDKIAPYVQWYKEHFKTISQWEGYKWQAIQTFQETFDIDAVNIYRNLSDALKDEINLLSGRFGSKSVLLKNALHSPEDIRLALRNLFDEEVPISQRVPEFVEAIDAINVVNQQRGYIRENERTHQDDHSVSVLLALRYPAKHFIFKYSMWYEAVRIMGLDYERLSAFTHTLLAYEQICYQLREVLMADSALVSLHDATYSNDASNYNLLTQDFLYAIYRYFHGLNTPPRHPSTSPL